jgi:riboflavin-specific deaminase-like protein
MSSQTIAESVRQQGAASDSAWRLLLAASALTGELEEDGRLRVFGDGGREGLRALSAESQDAAMAWRPGRGWECLLPVSDGRSEFINLYLPVCNATPGHPITIGHLGQSLDGFIATPSGDSQFVTGDDNLVHVHRMRALCDAVVVGAGTVACDDPQLTTRHVPGPNPLRVVVDPGRRLDPVFKVFTDRQAPTLYICGRSRLSPSERHVGAADVAEIDEGEPGREATQVMHILRARGCGRVLVEGGGVTVSAFLEADLLDRLQIAIAPVLIGEGRPAIRLLPQTHLRDCRRPAYRVYRMGGDILFDCELNARAETDPGTATGRVSRII